MMARILIPFSIIATIIIVSFFAFPGLEETIRQYYLHDHQDSKYLFSLISFLLLSSDFILPIPSSIIMFGNGWILGLPLGFAISITAMLLSSAAAYTLGHLGAKKVNKYYSLEDTANATLAFEKYGDYSIILSRGIPVLSETISIICGNTFYPFRKFVIANLIGYIPICFLYTYLGSISSNTEIFLWAIGINLTIAGVLWLLRKRAQLLV